MPVSGNLPYLLVSLSTEPDNTWPRQYLAAEVTCLGRPEHDQADTGTIDLKLDWVSRRHARIIRRSGEYILENWHGTNGIGVYERSLRPGESHALRHGDRFRIPDLSEAHARILFLIDDRKTMILPLHIDQRQQRVRVFDSLLPLRGIEYRLLAYLYDHEGDICSYDAILAHLWPDYEKVDGRRAELDVYLARVRAKLRDASGGFTFMQTIRGQGIRLVL
ncbi:MAG: winged helix-turn-helix domain-containing protein [Roseiflexaceae bacterium]